MNTPEPALLGRDVSARIVRLPLPVRSSSGGAVIRRAAALAVAYSLLNLPFWWLQREEFLSRPLFNIELFLPLLVAVRSVRGASLVLALLWMLDWASSNSLTFYFSSPLEFLRSATFLTSTHAWAFLSTERMWWSLPFWGCGAVALLFCRRAFGRRVPGWAALSLAVAIVAVDVSNGSSMLLNLPSRWINVNPAGSPVISLLARALHERQAASLRLLPTSDSTRKNVDVLAWAKAHPESSVLFVIVESLGSNRDAGLQGWLLGRLATREVRAGYVIQASQVPFQGATTSAELRELCSVRGGYRYVTSALAPDCLPAQLGAMGWRVDGFHGFSGKMFSRNDWWQDIGIVHARFAENLLRPSQAPCGAAFAGACDDAVIAQAGEAIRHARTLAYVLTLNSHLPLREIPIPADLATVCDHGAVRHEACLLTATIGLAMTAVAKAVQSAGATKPLVVVVGDHAPPFSTREVRDSYSQTHVPAYVLTPLEPP